MADIATASKENLNGLFAPTASSGLEEDILGVLESILRLYNITPQELFYKWESYCLKMAGGLGNEDSDVRLDLDTARMFSKDVQDSFVREDHKPSKHLGVGRGGEKKAGGHGAQATPRANAHTAGDVLGMLDQITPNAVPRRSGSVKRKADFDTPAPRKISRPSTVQKTEGNVASGIAFTERTNAGEVVELFNEHLPSADAPIAPSAEARIKVVANMDLKKFQFRPMSMRISDSSEMLDERIDEFANLIQQHYKLDDSAFGNPASQSTNEIVAVGRIACDTLEGKLNPASIVLETSRRMGAGLRVTLKVDELPSYSFFPGQIVALKGTNASGLYFTVKDTLSLPMLPVPSSVTGSIELINERLGVTEDSKGSPLNVLVASGPYTADDNLDFEPLRELCTKAADQMVDAMILTGPFIDIEHPMIAAGDFDLPGVKGAGPDATMTTAFRLWISSQLERVWSAVPSVTILLVPSVRDTISKHVSWPQEQFQRKELGLPVKYVKLLPNPAFVSLNENVFGISSQDVMYELSREQVSHNCGTDLLTRLPEWLIQQRHFFPLYPPLSRDKSAHGATAATGACLEIGYLKLGEWLNVRPDVLILPSLLTPSVKTVDDVTVINPGFLSRRKAAGTFSQMTIYPRIISEEERETKNVHHNVYERARVEVVRI